MFSVRLHAFLLYLAASVPLLAAVPAFPGAEGAGALSRGGRGGRTIYVSTLADSGDGSLRAAVEAKGPRTVVFAVSGIIELRSDLVIREPRITIAGQTAPGDGICLRGRPLRIEATSDVVVRHLRVRLGPAAGEPLDGIEVRDSRRVIIDHCSISWTIDEGLNTWHGVEDITVQWCLIAEPLNRSVHPKGAHGYGASLGGRKGSYHHNLFAHATARNPSVGGNRFERTTDFDFRANTIYNWQHRTCDGKPMTANVVNNYFKPGPATQRAVRHRVVRVDDTAAAYGYASRWHVSGNEVDGAPEVALDNWTDGVDFEGAANIEASRALAPFVVAAVTTESAKIAHALVLLEAGATRPRRDAVDARIVADVVAGTAYRGNGIIDHPDEVGGWPAYVALPSPQDRDRDGMPDEWELRHRLNPYDPADATEDSDDDGYTNLEHYLNELANRS